METYHFYHEKCGNVLKLKSAGLTVLQFLVTHIPYNFKHEDEFVHMMIGLLASLHLRLLWSDTGRENYQIIFFTVLTQILQSRFELILQEEHITLLVK